MSKIKQIIPVPQGRKYYAVYRDEKTNSEFFAERLDFIVIVKREYNSLFVEGLSGYAEPASDFDNYYGTYSEEALKNELPELWEEMKSDESLFQDEFSLLEKFIAEQRERLNYQSRQIDLLKEKIAELEKGRSNMVQRDLTSAEKIFCTETSDFDNPILPIDDEKNPADLTDDRAEISVTQTNTDENARDIILNDLCFCVGNRLDYGTIKALNASGMETLGDVADKTFDELLQTKSIGRVAMRKIFAVLGSHGLRLKDEKSAYLNSVIKLKKKGKTVTEISAELNIPASITEKYLKYAWRDLLNLKGGQKT